MTTLGLQGDGTVFNVASLGRITSEHSHISSCDHQQTTVNDALHRAVQEYRRASVRIQVNGVKTIFPSLVHEHPKNKSRSNVDYIVFTIVCEI